MDKIRIKYNEYAHLHGDLIFSYNQFKKRYLDFLHTRQPIEIFLFAEIQALEDRKNEIDEKINKKKRIEEAQDVLAKKEEELLKKISNYPTDSFNEDARLEIRKLVAIIKIIYPQIQKYSYDVPEKFKEIYQQAVSPFKSFTIQPYSGNFSKYDRELKSLSKNLKNIESIEQILIREWGISINTLIHLFLKIQGNTEIHKFVQILNKISEDFRLIIFKPLI